MPHLFFESLSFTNGFNRSINDAIIELIANLCEINTTNRMIGMSREIIRVHKSPLLMKLDEICGSHVF